MIKSKVKKNNVKQVVINITIIIFLVVSVVIFSLIVVDKKIMPYTMVMADNYIKSELNYKISKAVTNIIIENNIKTSDLYNVTFDSKGTVKAIETNTVLINNICSAVIENLSLDFLNSKIHVIEVPMGIILNVELFSNYGPTYKVRIKPIGAIDVTYDTSFTSAGVNQSNYKLNLTVDSKIQFANPLRVETIDVRREITLINNVINGDVPEGFYLK